MHGLVDSFGVRVEGDIVGAFSDVPFNDLFVRRDITGMERWHSFTTVSCARLFPGPGLCPSAGVRKWGGMGAARRHIAGSAWRRVGHFMVDRTPVSFT